MDDIIGKQFYGGKIISRYDDNLYVCAVACEPGDEPETRYLHKLELLEKIAAYEKEKKEEKENKRFWKTVPLGSTIHYHNCYGAFVRGVVIKTNTEDQQHCFMPTALVGKWSEHDLPKLLPDGTVGISHYAKSVLPPKPEHAYRPHTSCIYESPFFVKSVHVVQDPRTLPEIKLVIPTPTEEQLENIKLTKAVEEVRNLLRNEITSAKIDKAVETLLRIKSDIQ